jgi:hypothetical protein
MSTMRADIVVSLVEGWFIMLFPIDIAIVELAVALPVTIMSCKEL